MNVVLNQIQLHGLVNKQKKNTEFRVLFPGVWLNVLQQLVNVVNANRLRFLV